MISLQRQRWRSFLQEYLSEKKAIQNIPALRMITKEIEEITRDAQELEALLQQAELPAQIQMEPCESQIGGGSLPLERIPSMAVTIHPEKITTAELELRLRHMSVPMIVRTMNDKIVIDVRTVDKKMVSEDRKDAQRRKRYWSKGKQKRFA